MDNITSPTLTVIPRAEHSISRSRISPNALKVLYRLHNSGFRACVVGGGVRDLLLGREPKDFDVATDASPEEVRKLFRNCRLIGRRFRLAHVRFGREIIEVATFRGSATDSAEDKSADAELDEHGRILRDNVYGSIEQDAIRRDFTANALYYDIADFSVQDFVGGMEDLKNGHLRLIGDPDVRYREDPVRMLRAVRFSSKLGFRIEARSEAPLSRLGDLLASVPPARLFDELLKLFLEGNAVASYEALRKYGLFAHLFPDTEESLAGEDEGYPRMLLLRSLENTDRRVAEDRPVTPAFLFAALLWEPVRLRAPDLDPGTLQDAAEEVLKRQVQRVAIPKRFSLPMREIFMLQARFAMRRGKRPFRLLAHPRFRAAYDFLVLRADAGETDRDLADWWTAFQDADRAGQESLLAEASDADPGPAGKKRRRRKRKRKQPAQGESGGGE